MGLLRRSSPPRRVVRTDDEWRDRLSPEAFRVLRRAGTERPGSSTLEHPPDRPGTYRCAGCDAALFGATDQFDSRTGWPSFTRPAAENAVDTSLDFSMIVPRREVVCSDCGGHLGHVFGDGPAPTGQRYCVNGAALTLDTTGAG